jgi:hypothetical protein
LALAPTSMSRSAVSARIPRSYWSWVARVCPARDPERPVRHRVAEHVPAVAHQHVGRALRRHAGRGLVPQSGRDHSKHLRVRCRAEEHARRRHCSEQVLEQHVQPTPGRSRHD